MLRHFHFGGDIEHPSFFEKRDHASCDPYFGLRRIPRDPEHWRAKTGHSRQDLFESHAYVLLSA
jgi:hypothetical protein